MRFDNERIINLKQLVKELELETVVKTASKPVKPVKTKRFVLETKENPYEAHNRRYLRWYLHQTAQTK